MNHNRGGARLALGDRRGAIEDFSRSADLSPGYAAPRLNRAQARAELGDWAGAVADYENGLALLGTSDDRMNIRAYELETGKPRMDLETASGYGRYWIRLERGRLIVPCDSGFDVHDLR